MPIHRGPGREREPDPIERMYRAYINADVVGPQAMLAAVRELARSTEDKPPTLSTKNWLCNIIRDHERRAGGKGE